LKVICRGVKVGNGRSGCCGAGQVPSFRCFSMVGTRSCRAIHACRRRLFAILTTEPNGTVQPIHDKAMPVMLMTAADVEVWLNGTLEEALKLQKPQPDDALVITPYDEKKAA